MCIECELFIYRISCLPDCQHSREITQPTHIDVMILGTPFGDVAPEKGCCCASREPRQSIRGTPSHGAHRLRKPTYLLHLTHATESISFTGDRSGKEAQAEAYFVIY